MELTEAQRLFRQATAKFADEVVAPAAERLDAEEAFPEEIYRRMAENGFLGIAVAPEWGGAGAEILGWYTTFSSRDSIARRRSPVRVRRRTLLRSSRGS